MSAPRLATLFSLLPEDMVLAVLDALEEAGYYPEDNCDYRVARDIARTHCKPAPSPTVHKGLRAGGSA